MTINRLPIAILVAPMIACAADDATHLPDRSEYEAPRASIVPTVDGVADDMAWEDAEWRDIDYRWLGPEYDTTDYQGRYKVVWTEERIYILAEIVDDVLIDTHRGPLVQYWDDDCLEVFIDEDNSGGFHQFSHNAFAYHFSLDNRAVDFGTDEQPHEYTHHVESNWRQESEHLTWEVSIALYPDTYVDGADDNQPVALTAGKIIGFMIAYCDNDGSEFRENFIGSESVPTGAKDRGYIDAGLFGRLILSE